jgi:ABC-type amino acid transport substrate-binding protein
MTFGNEPTWRVAGVALAIAAVVFAAAPSVVLQKGSPLTRRVNAAVRALVVNGTLTRLQRRWLLTDLSRLRVLG